MDISGLLVDGTNRTSHDIGTVDLVTDLVYLPITNNVLICLLNETNTKS